MTTDPIQPTNEEEEQEQESLTRSIQPSGDTKDTSLSSDSGITNDPTGVNRGGD